MKINKWYVANSLNNVDGTYSTHFIFKIFKLNIHLSW